MKVLKAIIAFISGILATFAKAYGPVLALVCVAIVFDVVTGIIASKVEGTEITSTKARAGFWKKVGLVLALFFGVYLDYFIPMALAVVSIEIPFNLPFGLIFGCYIVFNEAISVAENFDRINPHILPIWVKALLKGGRDKLGNNPQIHEDENKEE